MGLNKKFYALLMTVYFLSSFSHAQTVYGVRANYLVSHAVHKVDNINIGSYESLEGFQLGIASEKILFGNFIYGRFDYLFSSLGWRESNRPENAIRLNYLKVNPMLKIGPPNWRRFYVQSGLYLGCAIIGKKDGEKIKFGRETDKMKAIDFGGTFGTGWQFDKIQIGFELQLGAANLSNVKNTSMRNINWMLLNATYLFGEHPASLPKYSNVNQRDAIPWYSKRNVLLLHLSLSPINPFRMMLENDIAKTNIGFMGGAVGLDFYHSMNQFVHLGFSKVSGGSKRTKLPKPTHFLAMSSNERENMSSDYIILSNNHNIGLFKRFTIGYGLSCARYEWRYRKTTWYWFFIPIPDVKEEIAVIRYALGFVFPAYYRIGKHANVGIVYRPTFFRPGMTKNFAYEHSFSIDLVWKLRLI